jgi:hypothetical protein
LAVQQFLLVPPPVESISHMQPNSEGHWEILADRARETPLQPLFYQLEARPAVASLDLIKDTNTYS